MYLIHSLETLNITSMIILASNSWLRKTILEASKLRFTTDSTGLDERALEQKNKDKTDEEIAIILAIAKAEIVQHKHPDAVVIAADNLPCFHPASVYISQLTLKRPWSCVYCSRAKQSGM